MLSGHYGGYTSVWRISRACDCWQEACSDSTRECVYLLRVKMEEIFENTKSNDDAVAAQAKIDLHELSQHAMELANSLLSFGGDKHGIGPTKASGIDAAIDEMFGGGNLRSGELKDFGIQIFFTKGISNLKQVTANKWMVRTPMTMWKKQDIIFMSMIKL
eukprot:scaffold226135_cov37-Attheya_sp.AAC.1